MTEPGMAWAHATNYTTALEEQDMTDTGTGDPLSKPVLPDPAATKCPTCQTWASRIPYDIGSGPEYTCAKCETCWGAMGQPLKASDLEWARAPLPTPGSVQRTETDLAKLSIKDHEGLT